MRGEVRNATRALSHAEALDILKAAEHGVLATVDAKGRPATVGMNHVWINGALYFHSGLEGEKIENIRHNPEVSYFVIGEAEVVYEQFIAVFASVAVHGRMVEVDEPTEKLAALTALVQRFANDQVPEQPMRDFIAIGVKNVVMLRLTPEHLTGKARRLRRRPCLGIDPNEL
jgi:nitroimidazol reductase NimA-like FMN-containing flavoprotein (pyridoxamine 5'-phosphate oxidase superfamily)